MTNQVTYFTPNNEDIVKGVIALSNEACLNLFLTLSNVVERMKESRKRDLTPDNLALCNRAIMESNRQLYFLIAYREVELKEVKRYYWDSVNP